VAWHLNFSPLRKDEYAKIFVKNQFFIYFYTLNNRLINLI